MFRKLIYLACVAALLVAVLFTLNGVMLSSGELPLEGRIRTAETNFAVTVTNRYKPLVVDASGKAEVSIILPFSTPTQGDYFVNVHKSPTELGTIIACGPLAMGVSPMR